MTSTPFYYCFWDDETGACDQVAADDSLWCARHTALALPERNQSAESSTLGSKKVEAPSPAKILCTATTMAGDPCRMPPRAGATLCVNHDPAYAAQQRANVRSGGLASGQARKPIPLSEVQLDFADREGIQAAIETLIKLELVGRISPTRSRNILRALTIAYRNFDEARFVPKVGRRVEHDRTRLWEARHDLQKNIACIAEESSLRDAETETARLERQSAFRPTRRNLPTSQPDQQPTTNNKPPAAYSSTHQYDNVSS